jgi:aminomethyltransferase
VEAALVWSIGKRRREEGGFIGEQRILRELAEGTNRKRTGIAPQGRAPARDGTKVLNEDGEEVGVSTSGGFGPTAGGPVAMGYVKPPFNKKDTPLKLVVRGKEMPARAASAIFVPHNYKR